MINRTPFIRLLLSALLCAPMTLASAEPARATEPARALLQTDPPSITSISPITAVAGTPTDIDIVGTGFWPTSTVKLDNVLLPVIDVTYHSDTSLTANTGTTYRTAGDIALEVVDEVLGASNSKTLAIIPGPTTQITITPASATLLINGQQQFTAVHTDDYGNLTPGNVTWSANASAGAIDNAGLFTAGTALGLHGNAVTADLGGATKSADVTINPGPPASLSVTPASIASAVAGTTADFTAVLKDSAQHVLTGYSVNWTVNHGAALQTAPNLSTALPATVRFPNVIGLNPTTVTATYNGLSDSSTVTVVPAELSNIIVTPATAQLSPQGTTTFSAIGYDAYNNAVLPGQCNQINWSTAPNSGSISGSPSAPGANVTYSAPNAAGAYSGAVRANCSGNNSVQGLADVTVTPGALNSLTITQITPNPLTPTQQVLFAVTGTDSVGNPVTLTGITWTICNTLVPCAAGSVQPGGGLQATVNLGTLVGTYANTLKVTASAAGSGAVSRSATIVINPGPLSRLAINPTGATLIPNATQNFAVTGYDFWNNVVPGSLANWIVKPGAGTPLTANNVATLNFHAGVTAANYGNAITATSTTNPAIFTVASVVVTSAAIDHILIAPLAVTLTPSATQVFVATAYDQFNNVVTPVAFSWTTANGAGQLISIGQTQATLRASATAGVYTGGVQASTAGKIGRADITVQSGGLASIRITPDPASLPVNGTQTFTAAGYDASNNSVALANPVWSAGSGVALVSASGNTAQFRALTVAGAFNGAVRVSSAGVNGSATVNVSAGAITSLKITPAGATLQASTGQTFVATGYDAGGNAVANLPVTWSALAGAGTIQSNGFFAAGNTPGVYLNAISATYNGIDRARHGHCDPVQPAFNRHHARFYLNGPGHHAHILGGRA